MKRKFRAFFERQCVHYLRMAHKAGRKRVNPIAYRWFRFCAWCEFRLRPVRKPLTYTEERIQSLREKLKQS